MLREEEKKDLILMTLLFDDQRKTRFEVVKGASLRATAGRHLRAFDLQELISDYSSHNEQQNKEVQRQQQRLQTQFFSYGGQTRREVSQHHHYYQPHQHRGSPRRQHLYLEQHHHLHAGC